MHDMQNSEQPILLVDAQNLFCRSYAAFPSMSNQGHQMGGVVGFLKTLRKICADFHPSLVVVCWESGGSARRRALYSDYKKNRKPEKLNRFYDQDDLPDTTENKVQQMVILVKLLECLPVCQVHVSDCEADDVIAYLAKRKFQDCQKVIASSDRDFYQLLDEKTKIYSLHKKRVVTANDVLEEFRITTQNFALAKAVCGDASDNIPGVTGVGFKTLAKKFPFFGGSDELLIEQVISFAQTNQKQSSVYRKVAENADLIKRNWRLVYLDMLAISADQVSRIDYTISTFKPVTNKIGFIKQLYKEGILNFEVDNFFVTFCALAYSLTEK